MWLLQWYNYLIHNYTTMCLWKTFYLYEGDLLTGLCYTDSYVYVEESKTATCLVLPLFAVRVYCRDCVPGSHALNPLQKPKWFECLRDLLSETLGNEIFYLKRGVGGRQYGLF